MADPARVIARLAGGLAAAQAADTHASRPIRFVVNAARVL